MAIIPQPPTNYTLKFSPQALAAGYPPAEWKMLGIGRDASGEYLRIVKGGVEVRLHGSIGAAWLSLLWEVRGGE